jgi:dihydrofolate reductase
MRKLIVAEFISLDGVVEAPEQWHFPYVNEEMFAAMWAGNAEADTMLLGRITYESFAGAFANAPADDQVAAQMNRPSKVVVSRTLREPTWANSTRLSGDVIDEVGRLKRQKGRAILVSGSIRLARTLLRAGLVDELSLLVHPIVVGTGRRLFSDEGTDGGTAASTAAGTDLSLELVSCDRFSTGVVHLVYRRP